MFRLFLLLLPMAAATLAGSAVVAALVAGFDGLTGILAAAAAGGIASVPVTWLVARRLR